MDHCTNRALPGWRSSQRRVVDANGTTEGRTSNDESITRRDSLLFTDFLILLKHGPFGSKVTGNALVADWPYSR